MNSTSIPCIPCLACLMMKVPSTSIPCFSTFRHCITFTSESVCRYKLQLHFHTYNILLKENELWLELRFGKYCAKFTLTEWRENQNFLSWAQAFPIQDFKQHILQFPSRINSLFQDTLAEQKNGHAFQVLM